MEEQQFVTLAHLASELGMDRSHLHKFVKDMGIVPFRVRTIESRNQLTSAVTPEEADRIREKREGFAIGHVVKDTVENEGVFYVIVLDPELRPNRIKVGFSSGLGSRMMDYRTSNPAARLVACWSCNRSWESAAIVALANVAETKRVSGEIFDCPGVDVVMRRCDEFFRLLGSERVDNEPVV